MTDQSKKDKGIALALLDRFNNYRLPRAIEMKQRVDKGECLDDKDHVILKGVEEDMHKIATLVDRNPEFRDIYDQARGLWTSIIDKDKENRAKAGKPS
jgi:hypothetical protein